jgi:hypothetical protein
VLQVRMQHYLRNGCDALQEKGSLQSKCIVSMLVSVLGGLSPASTVLFVVPVFLVRALIPTAFAIVSNVLELSLRMR